MSLADAIRELREGALSKLAWIHDYYNNTKVAWGIVDQYIGAGNPFTIRNIVTGTVTTQTDLAGLAQGYVSGDLAEATFQRFTAAFEHFFFDLLRLWLLADPRSLSGKDVKFSTVLESPDKDAIIAEVVNKELVEIAYRRPRDWFKYLEDRAKLGLKQARVLDD
jgi:hypothetical protein